MRKIIFLFLLAGMSVFAQEGVKPDLSNPNATLYTHLYFLMPDSYDLAKASTVIKGLPKKEAQEKAKKIKAVFDGKGLKIDFNKVPVDANYLDTIGVSNLAISKPIHRFAPFPLRLPEVYVEKVGNQWYFSTETIEKIDGIYADTFPWEFTWLEKKFPRIFSKTVYGVLIWKPIGLLLLIGFCFILYYILNPLIFFILKRIQKLSLKTTNFKSFDLLQDLTRPIVFILIVRFVKKIIPSFQLWDFNSYLIIGLSIAETVFWVFVFLKLMKLLLSIYNDYTKSTRTKLDNQLAPILNKMLMGLVVFIGFLHILTLFGVDPNAVIAGASIGGIAVAFAAQDSVKNFIGTIVIFLDKPFHIGDWIEIGSVSGVVESVGLRSTRVRASDTTLFQIPNSKVSEAEINNKGLRTYRRYNTELGIRYDTPPDLIEAFVLGIREIIKIHPDTESDSYNVEFTGFGDSALLIMVNVFFKHLNWGDEQSSKHRLHIAIVKLAAALGVDFAFPSSTLMIEQLPGQESLAQKYNTNEADIRKNVQEVLDEFEARDHVTDSNAGSIPD
ncbi:MAG: mechanosensitive ion channel family protein [Flavobacteriaceae bacterium]|nr:mechanosensitive ion channel family protein [Flavobacteriaceae bacterium]